MQNVQLVVVAFILFISAQAQTRMLLINSFNDGGPSSLNVNSLGLDQGVESVSSFFMDQGRMHVVSVPGQVASFWTMVSAPGQCLPLPPISTIETTLSFRIQMPAGVDMSIVLQTGTDGCQGIRNNSAVVRFSNYNDLSGTPAWVHIPLVDFDPSLSNYLNGRLTAVVFQFQPTPFPADIIMDDMQFVSRPRLLPLSVGPQYAMQLLNGPPQGTWNAPNSNGRCGPQFGWSGCSQGECCSSAGWCGATPLHCLSVQNLQALIPNSQMQMQQSNQAVWGAPLPNSRCGRDFNWAGCMPGQACSAAGFCGSSPAHFATAQSLPQNRNYFGSSNGYSSGQLVWGPERTDGRCGRDYNWAGCNNGCCSQAGVCGNTAQHCLNSQVLGQ